MFSFRPEHRLRKQRDFDRVYAARLYAADDILVLNGAANGLDHARLGLSISAKVGGAVIRNRWKRLIREAFRLSRHDLPRGLDIIARPQKGAAPNFEAIRQSLPALCRRISKRLERQSLKSDDSDERQVSKR